MSNYKYGMRYSTIRYFQEQAKGLHRMRGLLPFISMMHYYSENLSTMDARKIGHFAIQYAAIGKADSFRYKG